MVGHVAAAAEAPPPTLAKGLADTLKRKTAESVQKACADKAAEPALPQADTASAITTSGWCKTDEDDAASWPCDTPQEERDSLSDALSNVEHAEDKSVYLFDTTA